MLIKWELGWELISKGITKLKRIIEGLPEKKFTSEEIMMLYTTVYEMCTQQRPYDYSQRLYDNYCETCREYIRLKVLPSITEKHDEALLWELVSRWENHKVMISLMSRFFGYLDRYFVQNKSLPCLKKVGISCFRDLVYEEVEVEVQAAVTALSNRLSDQEREGEQVERALLENTRNVIVEIVQVERPLPILEDFQHFILEN